MAFRRRKSGFTLIELLIVVAIIAILAAIAYPSYLEQIRTTRRADAMAVLMEGAEFMERFYTENGRYDETTAGTAVALPFNKSPIDGSDKFYAIALPNDGLSASEYTLRATPTAGGSQAGTGNLEFNHLGQRFWDENGDGDVSDAGEDDWDKR